MRAGTRFTIALGFVGAVAMAAAAFGQVGVDEPRVDAPLAQELDDETREDRRARFQECRERFRAAETEEERVAIKEECGGTHRHGRFRHGERIVTGEFKVQTDDGFATVTTDHGAVTAVDAGAGTLTLERADGVTVTVTTNDETKIRMRGNREATLADIEVGDTARIVRFDDGSGQVVRAIFAHTTDDDAAAEPAVLRAA